MATPQADTITVAAGTTSYTLGLAPTYSPAPPVLNPPVAGFTGTPLIGALPLTVDFTDASTGTVTSRAWTFGDGGFSSATNPSHTYSAAGVYDVSLTATNSGGSNTLTRTAYVDAVAAPVADFTGTPLSGSIPLTVAFTNASTGSISSYAWTFGDGGTSAAASPSHTYNNAGTYTVAMTATGTGGTNTKTRTAYVATTAATVFT